MVQKNGNSYLSVENALKTILDQIKVQKETETVNVSDALNRITANTITAKRDIPAYDNSAMDGYLFLSNDLSAGIKKFPVSGEIRPEHQSPDLLEEKTSKRIMTGAPIPGGDYTVIPVEQVREMKDEVEVMEVPKRNPIRKQGEGYKKDTVVLNKGVQIRPYEMGLLIESGNRQCQVLKPILIAVQVTGSEIDEDMDSNGPVLESLISGWPGVDVTRWPVLDDEPEKVISRMKELKKSSDLVLTTGGISAGRHDYIFRSMKKLGANILVRKVKQKPGKPFTVTQLDGVPFLHLPGNPVSAVFSAEYYGKRAVKHMLGLKSKPLKAVAMQQLTNHRDKTLFLTGRLRVDDNNQLTIATESSIRSHLMQLYRENNAYVKLTPNSNYEAGDPVEVILFSGGEL